MFIYSVLSVWCRFAIYKNAVLLCFFLDTGGVDVNETPLKQELEVSCTAVIFVLVVAAI